MSWKFWDLYDRFVDEDMEPDLQKRIIHRRKWRLTVANTLIILIICNIFTLSAMLYAVPRLGSLVWARDIEEKVNVVHTRVKQDVSGEFDKLRYEVELQGKKVDIAYSMIRTKLIADSRAKIIEYRLRQCEADNVDSRQTWRTLMQAEQAKYLELTERDFVAPPCADL